MTAKGNVALVNQKERDGLGSSSADRENGSLPSPEFVVEENRIVEAYSHRTKNVPANWYTPFSEGDLLITQSIERSVLRSLQRFGCAPLEGKRILEVGCGTGHWLARFLVWGAEPEKVSGIDLLADKISQARRLLPAEVTLEARSATSLDFPDESFDLVFQFTVFSSILDDRMRQQAAAEMLRVLKPTGSIVWYDLCVDNPRNPDVRGVRKREIKNLFPGRLVHFDRLVLLAPLARAAPSLFRLLAPIKLLRTHYVALITLPRTTSQIPTESHELLPRNQAEQDCSSSAARA